MPSNCSVQFVNCVVNGPDNSRGGSGNLEFTNCAVHGLVGNVRNSLFTNCIIDSRGYTSLPTPFRLLNETNVASNCIATLIEDGESVFSYVNKTSNTDLSSEEYDALFVGDFYKLTDEAKALYLGSDGKEVGIYGGNFPYEVRIPCPQITKCNVAAKTTADGKLSVDIEVRAAE